jgi:hypothetical protein
MRSQYKVPSVEAPRKLWYSASRDDILDAIPGILGFSDSEFALNKLIIDESGLTAEDRAALGRLNYWAYLWGFAPAIELNIDRTRPSEEFVNHYLELKSASETGKVDPGRCNSQLHAESYCEHQLPASSSHGS